MYHALRSAIVTAARENSASAMRLALAGGGPWGWPAPLPVPPAVTSFGRIGELEVRLAASRKEIRRAQRIRYNASVDKRRGLRRSKIVGTYRLLRQDVAERHGGFYTASEFDLSPLLARHSGKKFLELGRSCVLPRYRSKRTIELLWRGIWAYAQHHEIDVLIGCASFSGVDPAALALPLNALRRFASAPPEWQAAPVAGRAARTVLLPAADLDRRDAMAGLPPLIKGYLRAGAWFGDGVVVDRAFGTTDVLAVLPLSNLDKRYRAHFASA
jgi:L-ornithine Nalpha-acyltransferase